MNTNARCVLALDQGTTSSRALVFGSRGEVLAVAQREFTQHFPRAGWVEHDANEIWETQSAVAVEALHKAGLKAGDVAALGITNQRETTVLWDRRTGVPIHNAIVWQDRRTASVCDQLRAAGHEKRVAEATGLLLDPYFSGTKAAWLLDNVPGARKRAESGELAFGTIDSWLIYKLTGGKLHATDPSNASRTLLYNLHTNQWDAEMARLFNVPISILPNVVASSGVIGEVAAPDALKGIPIAGIAGDQQAALFGQGCTSPGMAKNTYGTGCFALLHTGDKPAASRNRLLTTVAWKRGSRTEYALEGSVFDAGSAVQWLRDSLGIITAAPQINELATSVPDSAGVTFIPAFSGLGAPHWDAHARGTILGLTRAATKAHIARAALEGIAHSVCDVMEAMAGDAGKPLKELRVDGGLCASDPLMQIQADLLQTPLIRPKVLESTARGAAHLAAAAVGFWPDTLQPEAGRTFEPRLPPARAAELRAAWAIALRRVRT